VRRAGRAGALGLVALGLAATLLGSGGDRPGASATLRLFGPISSLAAGWQWVRTRIALYDGRPDLAYARAELALELDPAATEGWAYLAATMAFDRASPYRQPVPALRTRWTEAALEVLERGERSAARPAELAVQRGLILVLVGEAEGAIPWDGGAAAAWEAADAAFASAIEHDPGSAEGWTQRAANRVLRLGGPRLVPEAEGRRAAMEAGLALLDAARPRVRRPDLVDFQRGALLAVFAESGDGGVWPGGEVALLTEALAAFERASEAHFPLAPPAAEEARQALAAARAR
jgi:tetratricopeptide (TPR) repeat protein